MTWLTDPHAWIAFTTLLALELVLGIDNVVFISILGGKLRTGQQSTARILGLGLAMLMRIVLLFCLSWTFRLTAPLFVAVGQEISGRDLIFIVGGLFLLGKGTYEMHQRIEGGSSDIKPLFAIVPVSTPAEFVYQPARDGDIYVGVHGDIYRGQLWNLGEAFLRVRLREFTYFELRSSSPFSQK